MDNAGSTNKNMYNGSENEVVHEFNQSHVFNIDQLAELIHKYALATIDDGKIVRTWRCLLSEKYTNLRGIRSFHGFIIVKHL